MFEQHNEGTGSEYARIFRLLSAAKEEAEKLQLRNLMHLTNMALLQVVIAVSYTHLTLPTIYSV